MIVRCPLLPKTIGMAKFRKGISGQPLLLQLILRGLWARSQISTRQRVLPFHQHQIPLCGYSKLINFASLKCLAIGQEAMRLPPEMCIQEILLPRVIRWLDQPTLRVRRQGYIARIQHLPYAGLDNNGLKCAPCAESHLFPSCSLRPNTSFLGDPHIRSWRGPAARHYFYRFLRRAETSANYS